MEAVLERVRDARICGVQNYKNLSVAFLNGKEEMVDYLALEEAVKTGFNIKELSSATVPTLEVENATGKNVVLVVGEYVKGGRQNRMVSENAFLEPNYAGPINVRCVERGRWTGHSRNFDYGGCATTHVKFSDRQDTTWHATAYMLRSLGVQSPSNDLNSGFEEKRLELEDVLKLFTIPDNAVGMVACIGNNDDKVLVADIFSKPSSLQKYGKRFLRAHALEALAAPNPKDYVLSDSKLYRFLTSLVSANFEPKEQVSGGVHVGISGAVEGSALVRKEHTVYLTYTSAHNEGERVIPYDDCPTIMLPPNRPPRNV